jgi:hypothetical protein
MTTESGFLLHRALLEAQMIVDAHAQKGSNLLLHYIGQSLRIGAPLSSMVRDWFVGRLERIAAGEPAGKTLGAKPRRVGRPKNTRSQRDAQIRELERAVQARVAAGEVNLKTHQSVRAEIAEAYGLSTRTLDRILGKQERKRQ